MVRMWYLSKACDAAHQATLQHASLSAIASQSTKLWPLASAQNHLIDNKGLTSQSRYVTAQRNLASQATGPC